jgi:hypothetical protein
MTCLILILRKDNTFSALFLHLRGAKIRVFGAESVISGPRGAKRGENGAGGGKNRAIGAERGENGAGGERKWLYLRDT